MPKNMHEALIVKLALEFITKDFNFKSPTSDPQWNYQNDDIHAH